MKRNNILLSFIAGATTVLAVSCATGSSGSAGGEVTGIGGGSWAEPTPYGMVLVDRGSMKVGPAEADSLWNLEASARGIIGDGGENRRCGRFTAGGTYAVFHRHIVRDLHIGDGLDDIPVCTARLIAVQDLQYAEANILISLQRRGLPCGVRYGSLCGRSSRRRP